MKYGDLIDRQTAIDALNGIASDLHARKRLDEEYIASWCAETIEQLPSAQPWRKTGKWIIEPYDVENDIWVHRCGECMKVAMLGIKKSRFNYCPNCGARMVQEGEDNA